MDNIKKGDRIKILDGGYEIDKAIVVEVSNNPLVVNVKGDRYPNIIIKFRFIDYFDSWYLSFEGLLGESCFNKRFPYSLCLT